tara:strand:- start:3031 stop:3669 length:639 start_codon:yes stop_codon:yes gene_type:complete
MSENKKSSPNKFLGRLLDNVLTGGQIYKGIASRKRDRLAAEAEFDARLKAYEESTFQELDPDDYKQENVFEDIQVDTQAAEFASEQFRQQQANIMEVYRGTAGGSGVAALAQTLSNQAAKQAKDTSVNIAQQLAQNKKIKLGEESRIKQEERQMQINNALGKRQFEADKMATMIGVAGQKIAGVNLRTQNAIAIGGQVVEGITSIGKTIAAF